MLVSRDGKTLTILGEEARSLLCWLGRVTDNYKGAGTELR